MKKNEKRPPQLLEATESVFRAGACVANPATLDQVFWFDRAKKLSSLVSPDELSAVAFDLLGEIPFGEAIDIVDGIKRGKHVREGLKRLTMIRKCCYAARDLMILTSEENPHHEAEPLFDACRFLGFIADSDGAIGRGRTLNAMQSLEKHPLKPKRFRPLKSQMGFESAVDVRLESAELLIWGADSVTYDTYHEARKDYRRVLAVAVMSAAGLGLDDDYRNFAVEGVALSNWHGQIKDELCATEQWRERELALVS